MSRLFWKFFLAIFFAQLVTVGVLAGLFWLHDPHRSVPPDAEFDASRPPPGWVPPPGMPPHGPAGGMRPPPRLPTGQLPLLPLGVGLFASLLFAVLLARHFSRPIVSLRKAFEAVGQGDFDLRLTEAMRGRHDELADLGREFERTAAQIKALLAGQRRLLHDVSHEVRSPLARMQLAIDLARQQPDKLVASIERIEREAARIDRLMEELLTLARLEARAYGALDDSVDVVELVTEVVENARFEAQAKGCAVTMTVSGEAPVKGRADLLQRAIENVVRNAVRHTFEHTTVGVEVALLDDRLLIRVDDDGPGLPEAALAGMFEPFVRFGEQPGSYGLGLAITREVVVAHAGRIEASLRPNGGLRVLIELPAQLN